MEEEARALVEAASNLRAARVTGAALFDPDRERAWVSTLLAWRAVWARRRDLGSIDGMREESPECRRAGLALAASSVESAALAVAWLVAPSDPLLWLRDRETGLRPHPATVAALAARGRRVCASSVPLTPSAQRTIPPRLREAAARYRALSADPPPTVSVDRERAAALLRVAAAGCASAADGLALLWWRDPVASSSIPRCARR